jgi:hypothetical protein
MTSTCVCPIAFIEQKGYRMEGTIAICNNCGLAENLSIPKAVKPEKSDAATVSSAYRTKQLSIVSSSANSLTAGMFLFVLFQAILVTWGLHAFAQAAEIDLPVAPIFFGVIVSFGPMIFVVRAIVLVVKAIEAANSK